jgi:hypothetical protein
MHKFIINFLKTQQDPEMWVRGIGEMEYVLALQSLRFLSPDKDGVAWCGMVWHGELSKWSRSL